MPPSRAALDNENGVGTGSKADTAVVKQTRPSALRQPSLSPRESLALSGPMNVVRSKFSRDFAECPIGCLLNIMLSTTIMCFVIY
jgi:hypothetical protein